MERRVNVRGVVVDEGGNVFGVKHRMRNGNESEYWATPGGGLDPRESLHDGLTREFVEELGIVPQIGRLLFVQQFVARHHDGREKEKLEFFFHIENTDDFKKGIDLSKTSHGHELVRADFVEPSVFFLPKFFQELNIKDYIDTAKPVYYSNNLNVPYQ